MATQGVQIINVAFCSPVCAMKMMIVATIATKTDCFAKVMFLGYITSRTSKRTYINLKDLARENPSFQ